MKKILSFLLATVMLLSMSACDSSTSSTTSESTATDGAITIGYATKSSSSPFWVENIRGAEAAAADLGINITVIGPPLENDVSGQISVIEDLISAGVDGLCIAPCGTVGVSDVVGKAMEQGIPVVCVDEQIEGVDITSFVSTDNYNAGAMAAEFIGEEIGGEGKVIIVNGMIAQGSGKGRREGFIDYMADTYGDAVEIVEVTADWDDTKALSGFEAAYAANTDVVGAYCAWDGGALQIWQVLTDNKRDDVAICGFDCYDTALQLMADGDSMFLADVAQNPYNMGYKAVETAYAAVQGEEIETAIDTGTTLVTAENVREYAETNGVTLA